jgi:ABC-type multidrug transport system ATPase subunit
MVEVNGLVRSFGTRVVLEGLSFGAAPSSRTALIGSNGSGKTTLLRCLLGTLTPDEGNISVSGFAAGSIDARRLTGATLSQERSFYMRLSGRENLAFFAGLRGLSSRRARAVVDLVVEELALESVAAQRVDRCSTGQLQQLAFARALLGDPEVLLLDEPTRSLDTEARARLWGALDTRPAMTVFYATHLAEDLERATQIIELGSGDASGR